MGRKHKHEEHINLERWLVSYADFVTLLFATFTALYAVSIVDKSKALAFEESIKQSMGASSYDPLRPALSLGFHPGPATQPASPDGKSRQPGLAASAAASECVSPLRHHWPARAAPAVPR